MTSEEHYNNMMEIFGNVIPNPEHHPNKFMYYATLYKHLYLGGLLQVNDSEEPLQLTDS